MIKIKKGDKLYYTRCHPILGIYDILLVKVRGVYNDHFVVIDNKSKQALLFNNSELENNFFLERKDAVIYSEQQEKLNKNKKKYSDEKYYEEF